MPGNKVIGRGMRAKVSTVKPLQKASTYLKGKTSAALRRSRKLAGAIDELARTIGDSGLEPWMKMETHLLVGE